MDKIAHGIQGLVRNALPQAADEIKKNTKATKALQVAIVAMLAAWTLEQVYKATRAFLEMRDAQMSAAAAARQYLEIANDLVEKHADMKDFRLPGDFADAAIEDLKELRANLWSARAYYIGLIAKQEEQLDMLERMNLKGGEAWNSATAKVKEYKARLGEISGEMKNINETIGQTAEAQTAAAGKAVAALDREIKKIEEKNGKSISLAETEFAEKEALYKKTLKAAEESLGKESQAYKSLFDYIANLREDDSRKKKAVTEQGTEDLKLSMEKQVAEIELAEARGVAEKEDASQRKLEIEKQYLLDSLRKALEYYDSVKELYPEDAKAAEAAMKKIEQAEQDLLDFKVKAERAAADAAKKAEQDRVRDAEEAHRKLVDLIAQETDTRSAKNQFPGVRCIRQRNISCLRWRGTRTSTRDIPLFPGERTDR